MGTRNLSENIVDRGMQYRLNYYTHNYWPCASTYWKTNPPLYRTTYLDTRSYNFVVGPTSRGPIFLYFPFQTINEQELSTMYMRRTRKLMRTRKCFLQVPLHWNVRMMDGVLLFVPRKRMHSWRRTKNDMKTEQIWCSCSASNLPLL